MRLKTTIATIAGLLISSGAYADTGKLLLTGGVTSIDGAAGGGLTPWAVIGSNATADQIGGTVHFSRAKVNDYSLNTYGASVGIMDRVELSLARQDFDASPVVGVNGLGFNVSNSQHIKMDILGVKVKVAGDAILDSDTLMPQIAVGVEFKKTDAGSFSPVIAALGAKDTGVDFYVSATKLFLAQSILVNATLRATRANQNGLLGFGAAAGENNYKFEPEFSVAYLVTKNVVIGAEYRFKPNNLERVGNTLPLPRNGLREEDWKDVFIAYAPMKNISFTLAYVDLGHIAPVLVKNRKQTGVFLSSQIAF
ncbi:DUF3034 family protein [Glaciimonas immobilis]|uniref:DUF3034 family protein n=1 Tax=Glaciimonas immobilis TaxID=728004 RepID=A0A840RQW0_9BURK|nr:DUF3034 family protein [Glaciimonas immobilis]KAF3997836.1 DUF3034 family protein [Glaciimonas immobilis]MBB5199532.1 hypothetical protein [Glaciimonas immobilis]